MKKYVVVASNIDGGFATIHASFDAAVAWLRAHICDDEEMDAEEKERAFRDLADVGPEYVQGVQGSDAWKEWFYIGPAEEIALQAERNTR